MANNLHTTDNIDKVSHSRIITPLLGNQFLFSLNISIVVEIILQIKTNTNFNDNIVRFGRSGICTDGRIVIESIYRPLEFSNIQLNKCEIVFLLRRWYIYNISLIDTENGNRIEELIHTIEASTTIEQILHNCILLAITLH